MAASASHAVAYTISPIFKHIIVCVQPSVANILLFNFYEQKFIQYCPITIAIDCKGLSWLSLEEKWPNYASLGVSAFQCMRAGFLCPKCDNFACLHTRQDQNELHLKR